MITDVVYDPLDFESLRDPYPLYRVLRDEFPVYHNPAREIWALTRFEDVQAASRDWETFATVPGVDLDDFVDVLGPGSIIDLDPPRHDELRDVVRKHFAPSAILRREAEMTALADTLLDELLEHETADLAADFAWQLPVAVISMLLGFPSEDRRDLSTLALEFAYRESGELRVPERTRAAARELRGYFGDLMSDRLRRPRNDVLSEIAAADHSATVSFEEAISICNLLFLAGIETTASLLSNSFHILSHQPEKAELLRERPQLMPRAVEELLRYESPVQHLARSTTRAVRLHDTEIPAGARVVLVHGSANRDERRFPDPDVLDFEREVKRTLAFGEGIHFCLGAPLARPEARIALSRFLARVEAFELCGEPERTQAGNTRGFARLPCALRLSVRGSEDA
jgi:cytochrome P450